MVQCTRLKRTWATTVEPTQHRRRGWEQNALGQCLPAAMSSATDNTSSKEPEEAQYKLGFDVNCYQSETPNKTLRSVTVRFRVSN